MTHPVKRMKRNETRAKGLAAALCAVGLLMGTGAASPTARVPVATQAQGQAVELAPHELAYDIRLKDVSDRSSIVFASGSLLSRLEGASCEGWTSTSRMKVRFVFERRGERETESRVTSWESDDGNHYHSLIERYMNGARMETIRVQASRPRAGVPFTLRMTEPERLTTTLPASTLFPTMALKRLIQAARAGRRTLSMLIYEGDREAAPQRVVAIIGARREGRVSATSTGDDAVSTTPETSEDNATAVAALRGKPYWPVSLAYYGVENGSSGPAEADETRKQREEEERRFGLPEYEVHFRLYDNGVTGDALLIYPDYVLKAQVKSLRMLPAPACE